MKNIKTYLLILICSLVLFSCEKDQDVILTQLQVVKEQLTPSYTSIAVECQLSTSASISYVYVQYATTGDFAEYKEVAMYKKNGNYNAKLSDLEDNTTYYIRYAVSNIYSVGISKDVSEVKTLAQSVPISVPVVTTASASNITSTSATIGGNVTSDGGASVTERGVVYSTSKKPTTSNSKKTSGSGTGRFSISLTGLSNGTTYYARAYAINSKGTAYGNEVSFTTQTYSVPVVTTTSASNITSTSATVGGNVTSDGGTSVTERGIVYSTSQNPTTSNSKKTSGSGTGSFSVGLTGLTEGTTYYVRAYAINSKGTSYGEQVSFTTTSYSLPTVTTISASNVTTTTATVGGNVTSDGGATVTERGVVYSTVSNPVINNIYHTTITSGSGTGSFSVALTGLTEGTTYYVRAYAINSMGTSYGSQINFTTNTSSSGGVENGHEYVDLGLPSGLKWATCNVGASKPEDYGGYFAWGETTTKSTYDWSTYKWCKGTEDTQTKYCTNSSYGTVDNKTLLDKEDDAAAANWGGNWRMPTKAEQEELQNNCTWTWTTQNGVNGFKVTSKSNGNYIFLPAAGYRSDSSLYRAGSYGYYWSSSLNTDYPIRAWGVFFSSDFVLRYSSYRYYGFSVRPVCQ